MVTSSHSSATFGAPSYSIQTGRLPFSRGGLYRLPFSESYAITADGTTGTASVANTYVLTGPYDPRFQIGGDQPIQWDQVAARFQKYQVNKAVCTITFNNPVYDGALVGFRVRSSNNSVVTQGRQISEIKEMDNTRSKWVNNTGNQTRTFKCVIRPWNIMGLSKLQYKSELSYQSLTTANGAATQVLLEPFLLHTIASEVNLIRCTVRIVYYIQFMEGITVLDS